MANQDNECSNLEIPDKYEENIGQDIYGDLGTVFLSDTLGDILEKQKELQENIYFPKLPLHVSYANKRFEDMTLKELKDFWLTNSHALQDEIHEMFDALGGIKNGIGSGVWKHWKTTHKDINSMTLKDLSPNDLLELKFEAIDMLHFVMNFFASIGMTSKEIYNMYFSKHQENINRQINNY